MWASPNSCCIDATSGFLFFSEKWMPCRFSTSQISCCSIRSPARNGCARLVRKIQSDCAFILEYDRQLHNDVWKSFFNRQNPHFRILRRSSDCRGRMLRNMEVIDAEKDPAVSGKILRGAISRRTPMRHRVLPTSRRALKGSRIPRRRPSGK